jgi:GDP-4-dehydro-6-deoxy-D-mannose reductase
VEAQINVLDALVNLRELQKVLVIGSAEEYGPVAEADLPITEEQTLKPMSPYAVSKVTQDFLGLQYFLHHEMPIVRLRPFNHTGERQAPVFVIPAFAKQIAEIEAGIKEPVVKVGNLEAYRDFTDVKDMMKAYLIAMQMAEPGDVYNLGSGQSYQIKAVLDQLIALVKTPISVIQDPERLQPSDVPKLVCDATKFREITGWQPEIPLSQTLSRVLDYWRNESQK